MLMCIRCKKDVRFDDAVFVGHACFCLICGYKHVLDLMYEEGLGDSVADLMFEEGLGDEHE